MIRELIARWKQGHRTIRFPSGPVSLPDRYRGLPAINCDKGAKGCDICRDACPTRAISKSNNDIQIDMGRCLFCPECEIACPDKAINFSGEYSLAAAKRNDLVFSKSKEFKLYQPLDKKIHSFFGRSLKLRQVSAAGCNACEADANVLSTIVFDMGRFGIQFVASPRHADGILVTGPVSKNMKTALMKTYDAVPSPKIVIAMGACAISGGPYVGHEEASNGIEGLLPVDLYIPGCPPNPFTTLDGLLKLIGRKA